MMLARIESSLRTGVGAAAIRRSGGAVTGGVGAAAGADAVAMAGNDGVGVPVGVGDDTGAGGTSFDDRVVSGSRVLSSVVDGTSAPATVTGCFGIADDASATGPDDEGGGDIGRLGTD